ncbi:MAG: inverse autotransporter beta domain-containing protein, partial [Deltaproteobacteria bacterium]|nr:inverse autotransporter beta domain-containing protein [Deltaproteobacteria bacterium]
MTAHPFISPPSLRLTSRLLGDLTFLAILVALGLIVIGCSAQESAPKPHKKPPNLTAALFPHLKELASEGISKAQPKTHAPRQSPKKENNPVNERNPAPLTSEPRENQNPSVISKSFYELQVLGTLYPGRPGNLELRLLAREPLPKSGLALTILPQAAFENLKPNLRRTNSQGVLKIKGLIVKAGYAQIPLTVDIGPGLSRATALVKVEKSESQMTLLSLRKRSGGLSPPESQDSVYDLELGFKVRGLDYNGSLTFLPSPSFPNLRNGSRLARNGRVLLKGLKILKASDLVANLKGEMSPMALLVDPGNDFKTRETREEISPSRTTESPKSSKGFLGQALETLVASSYALAGSSGSSRSEGRGNFIGAAVSKGLNVLGSTIGQKLSPWGQWRSRFSSGAWGEFQGGVDYFRPFIEKEPWLFFGQGGASWTEKGRLLAYFGLGQRFFPKADLAWGYNAFIEGDLKRAHYRAGWGFELWYAKLKLAANFYQSLGPWRRSPDYPQWPVWERAASGWDIRASGQVPFVKNLSLTGSVGQWRGLFNSQGGAQIGSFDPNRSGGRGLSFSYGLSYSPWPFLTATLTRDKTNGQKTQMNYGLAFNFRPGQPWFQNQDSDQEEASPSSAVQLARHDFVDRDYHLPLAYKGQTIHKILLVADLGQGLYRFRVIDGFDRILTNQTVFASLADPLGLIYDPLSQKVVNSFVTNESGEFLALFQSPSGAPTELVLRSSDGEGQFIVKPLALDPETIEEPKEEEKPPADPLAIIHAISLKANKSPDFTFELLDQDQSPAPQEEVAAETLDGVIQILSPRTRSITASFLTNQEGLFDLSLGPQPGYPQTQLALTPPKGTRKVFNLPLPHELALSASIDALTTLEPTAVTLTVLFNNNPLPLGTEVVLSGPDGAWDNLPEKAAVSDKGEIFLPNLIANYQGSLNIEATVAGYSAGTVTLVSTALTGPDQLTLTVNPSTLNYGQTSTLTLTILKNNQP